MAANHFDIVGASSVLVDREVDRSRFAGVFESMTAKQHQVFELVAENRTSKEIAGLLGVSESAVNQRIEAVRLRAGSVPRAQIARDYRLFRARRTPQATRAPISVVEDHGAAFTPASADRIGPPLPMQLNLRLNRVAVMVAIAAGLMIVAMVGLSVAQALTAIG